MNSKLILLVALGQLILSCCNGQSSHEGSWKDGDPGAPDNYRDGWKDVSKALEIELKKDKNEIVFRTINLAGITGPEHKIIIK